MEAMIERCEKVTAQYNELNEKLMSEEVMRDNRLMAKIGKEQAAIRQLVETYAEFKEIKKHYDDAMELRKDSDKELAEMAEMEIEELGPKLEEYQEKIRVLLIPKDPNDIEDAVMEIRGAAGGDEGNIFAGDLFRMYSRYAESKGWKVEVVDEEDGEAGGFSEISFIVKGEGAYGELKFESGAHRVQRVPKTESQGRIQTSTATVLVLPDTDDVEIEIDEADLTIETHRASGAGGQHINKTDSAVRIVHLPTGITVNCQDGRSQHANRDTAMRLIKQRVYDYYQQKAEAEKGVERRSKIGTGDRSEKIRTYNYPQNRVTDHRIGLTIQQLDRIMEGKLDDIIAALLKEDERLKIAGEENAQL